MRGSMQQRSKGTWRLRYDGPEASSGNRKQVSETVRGTRKEAEQVLRERLASMDSGGYVARHRETVAEFLARWLETYVATNTAPSTQRGYRGVARRYVVPAFGGVQLQSLRPQQIQGLYAAMLKRGLSPRTVLHTHRMLREALAHGVKWGDLVRNPANATTPPKPEKKKVGMWDATTVQRFLRAAEASPYRDIYELAALTGTRRGELLGLKWAAVDLEDKKLQVVSTLQRLSGMGLVEGPPRKGHSQRSIALGSATVDLLHRVHAHQLTQRLAAGPAWEGRDHIFAQANGKPLHPDKVSNDFRAIVVKAGLPHLTLHGLRHAHASMMLAAGVHPKVVSERLGHSSITVTMDTYSHVLPGLQEAAALALDEQLHDAAQGL